MNLDELTTRIGDWMRFWAPEVKRRIDRNEPGFAELVRAYEMFRADSSNALLADLVWTRMQTCQKIFDQAPPGAYDYLAHIGTYIP